MTMSVATHTPDQRARGARRALPEAGRRSSGPQPEAAPTARGLGALAHAAPVAGLGSAGQVLRAARGSEDPLAGSPAPRAVYDAMGAAGQPLEPPLRTRFEATLGRDLGGVRLHTDGPAAASADVIQAQAYTVGRDVVFARDAYRPHTAEGQQLLAHELVHVAQGDGGPRPASLTIGSAHSPLEREASAASRALLAGPTASQPAVTPAAGSVVARQPAPPAVATAGGGTNFVQLISGRYVGDLEGADANVREDVLFVLGNLNRLWSIPNDVYAAEQATVAARPADSRLSAASIPTTIAALRRNEDPSINDQVALALLGVTLSASVSNSRSNARADIYALQDALHANWNMTSSEYTADRARVNAGPDPVNNADIAATFRGLARFKAAFVGGTSRRNGPLSGTAPPTAQQTASRNAALITPGTATTTTTVGGVTTTTRQGFKDTVKVGGVNRTYRQDLWAEMDAVVKWMHKQASDMFARPRIGGGAAGDVSAFEPIGDTAKQQVDAIYGTSRQFGPRFHSGVNLRDASQRAGDAVDMIRYLVDNQEELGVVRARHNADHSPGRPERAIAETFKTDYVAHGSNRARLVLVDRGWPALNQGGIVSIQPFEGATPAETRRVRWKAFQTMIHEYFHTLNHPNYYRYAGELGGDDRSVLVEGGASLMTDHAWSRIGPAIPGSAALRAAVEGSALAHSAAVIPPINDTHYHPQFEQARDIETAVGRANFEAAFLTGRMELIGYGRSGPASAAAATATQTFVVPASGVRTLADVAFRTQTPIGQLASLNGLPANAVVTPGQRLLTQGMP
jgi:hypothetical protein